MKILIIKLHALGDVIASTPFFKLIKDYNNDYKVDHLVEKSCSDITKNNPYVLNQITTKFILSENNYNYFYTILFNFFEMLRLIFILRKNKYEIVYIFHRNYFFQILCKLSGIKNIVGFQSKKNYFLDFSIKYSFEVNRTIQEYSLIYKSGLKIRKPKFLDFYPNYNKINHKLTNSLPRKYIVCNPGGGNIVASAQNRIWPIDKYIIAISKFKLPTIILGNGVYDECISKYLNKKNLNCINLINKTNINEAAVILKNSEFYIGNDSAMLYLAASMRVKTIGLFGPTQVLAANPIGSDQYYIEGKVFCSPCYNPYDGTKGKMYSCKDNICMQSISVTRLLEKVEEILKTS